MDRFSIEHQFWNVRESGEDAHVLDQSWSQYPAGSVVRSYVPLNRHMLEDIQPTIERCALLLERVLACLRKR